MNVDVRYLPRLWVGAVLAAALLADRSVGGPGNSDASLSAAGSPPSAVTSPASGESVPVVLQVGDVVVTATLRLGAVSSRLDETAAAGNRFTVWVDRADRIGTWSNDRADQP